MCQVLTNLSSEMLRSSDQYPDITTPSPLSEYREEQFCEDNYSDEEELPCHHYGAYKSFEFICNPVTNTLTEICTNCGGLYSSSS